MKRIHSFEFNDQAWLPETIRRAGMEFLATLLRLTKVYRPTAKALTELLRSTGEKKIVVLGAGSGGGILDVLEDLPLTARITLTDLYPDEDFVSPDPRVAYYPASVDALNVPENLNGVRVMYTIFHHFRPEMAKAVLASVVKDRQPIAIFEASERSVAGIMLALLNPIFVLLMTPFARPFRLSRYFWTYLIPVIPIGALWDGLVSSFRTYSVEEIREMISNFPEYDWKIQVLKGIAGSSVFSVTGSPKRQM